MNKQTFSIPEGCKAVTVEQVGNQIITTFKPTFKRGDVLISKLGSVCVFNEVFDNDNKIRPFCAISPSEDIYI